MRTPLLAAALVAASAPLSAQCPQVELLPQDVSITDRFGARVVLNDGDVWVASPDWTAPGGGYFISFESRPGLAAEIVRLANDIGVKLTPAGATYPYGEDPQDSNIRLSPTFPSLEDVEATAKAFVVCVKLASVRQQLAQA